MPLAAATSAIESALRSLARFDGGGAPVTTCYLDVDGRRHPRHSDVERRLSAVLRDGRAAANGHGHHPSVQADLRRIEEWVRGGIDRTVTRGVAFFACSARGLFEAVALPVPVRDRLVIDQVPALAQLEAVLQRREPIAVLLADAQRARLLVLELGILVEHAALVEQLPRGDAGHADRGDLSSAASAERAAHLRHAADAAWQLYQERSFSHLAIGAPDPLARQLEGALHPYLRERLCGRIDVSPSAAVVDIRAAALEVEARVEREREDATVARVLDAMRGGGRAVAGLAPTLAALAERRVEQLIVSDGYEEEGWRCPSSGTLAAVGPASPVTGERMDRVADVVELAVDHALATGCGVVVCASSADLDVHGRIAALLRY